MFVRYCAVSWRLREAVAVWVTAAVSAGSMKVAAALVWTFRRAWVASAAGPEIEVALAEKSARDRHDSGIAPAREAALGFVVVGQDPREVVRSVLRLIGGRASGDESRRELPPERHGLSVHGHGLVVVDDGRRDPVQVLGRRGEPPREEATDQQRQEHERDECDAAQTLDAGVGGESGARHVSLRPRRRRRIDTDSVLTCERPFRRERCRRRRTFQRTRR